MRRRDDRLTLVEPPPAPVETTESISSTAFEPLRRKVSMSVRTFTDTEFPGGVSG